MRVKELVEREVGVPDGARVDRGWCLGPGPARYGWYLRYATGACEWLGRDLQAVRERAQRNAAVPAGKERAS